MSRNNPERLGLPPQPDAAEDATAAVQATAASAPTTLSYVSPTEFVELPSEGKLYPSDHPLHNQETIEIRYMTARDEDILTSKALLRKGLAIDRMLQNLVVDNQIKIDDLLLGDKNAVILAARISGYGESYETSITCPNCNVASTCDFNLADFEGHLGKALSGEVEEIKATTDGLFEVTLPKTQYEVVYRLLNGHDEKYLTESASRKAKLNLPDSVSTDLLKRVVVSVSGVTSGSEIGTFIDNMPALDSRFLRACVQGSTPNVDMSQLFSCVHCGYESEMEVPLTADFFWPK